MTMMMMMDVVSTTVTTHSSGCSRFRSVFLFRFPILFLDTIRSCIVTIPLLLLLLLMWSDLYLFRFAVIRRMTVRDP